LRTNSATAREYFNMTDLDNEIPPETADGIPITHDPATGEVIETPTPLAPNFEPKTRKARSWGGAEFDGDIIKLQSGKTLELPRIDSSCR
jgi:hypothetical protein